MFTAIVVLSTLVTAQEPGTGGLAPATPVWHGDRTMLAGRCVDGGGRPVSGAKVEVHRQDYRNHRVDLARAAVAGADGRFRIDGLDGYEPKDWGWTYHFVVGRAAGRAVAIARVRSDDVPQDALRLVFGEAATLTGTVVDPQDAPIADADVSVWMVGGVPGAPSYAEMWFSEPFAGWIARTDARGHFQLEGLPRGAKISISARHPLFARKNLQGFEAPGDARIGMVPGATIAGRVLDAAGKPVAFALVQAQGVQQSSWATARTDDQGRYRLESLPEEPYNVWTCVDGWTVTALDSFPVIGGQVMAAPDLQLRKGGCIRGRVVDVASGKGVMPGRHGDVGLYGPSRPRSGAAIEVAHIGPDGTFAIRAAPGSNHVYVRCGDGWHAVGIEAHDVEVVEGQEVEVEFRVQNGGRGRPGK